PIYRIVLKVEQRFRRVGALLGRGSGGRAFLVLDGNGYRHLAVVDGDGRRLGLGLGYHVGGGAPGDTLALLLVEARFGLARDEPGTSSQPQAEKKQKPERGSDHAPGRQEQKPGALVGALSR